MTAKLLGVHTMSNTASSNESFLLDNTLAILPHRMCEKGSFSPKGKLNKNVILHNQHKQQPGDLLH